MFQLDSTWFLLVRSDILLCMDRSLDRTSHLWHSASFTTRKVYNPRNLPPALQQTDRDPPGRRFHPLPPSTPPTAQPLLSASLKRDCSINTWGKYLSHEKQWDHNFNLLKYIYLMFITHLQLYWHRSVCCKTWISIEFLSRAIVDRRSSERRENRGWHKCEEKIGDGTNVKRK